MAEHIVAVFETEASAAAAAKSLENAGFPSSAIRKYAGSGVGRQEIEPTEHTSTTHTSGGGFWAWLFGEEPTTSETTRSAYSHDAYDRRASTGNVVVSVTVYDDAKIDQAINALEAHNPIDIDERSDRKDEGTTSSTAPRTGPSTVGRDFSSGEVVQADETDRGSLAMPAASRAMPDTGSAAAEPKGEQVLSLAEEQLEVGKRTVDRGTTRIRRYVVEKPVEQDVTLRGERVTVERRQPIETTSAPGAGAFEERVVEVHETAEEPVVAKTARVAEEVVVGREATERTERVKDTGLRREEVDISGDGKKP